MFSRRSQFERRSNPLEQARIAARAEGRAVYDLTASNPTAAGLPRFDAAFEALGSLNHADVADYRPESFGLRSARHAASRFIAAGGVHVDPERIAVTASTSEAYGFAFKLLCDPGDEVLVPSPSYPLLEHLAQLESVVVRPYPLAYDGHWHIPASSFDGLVGPRTRAVVTVTPNNPTGSFLKRDELDRLCALGLPIVSDEVFAPYALSPEPTAVPSALVASDALVLSLHGLSKLAGLPQLKLAFMCVHGPDAIVAEVLARLEVIADAFLSVGTPVQLALPEILAQHGPITEAICERLRNNLTHLQASLADSAVSPLHVEGGWYAILRLPALLDDEAWAIDLLQHADVLVQPGYFYGLGDGAGPRAPYAVISLLTEEPIMTAGLQRLRARVDAVVRG